MTIPVIRMRNDGIPCVFDKTGGGNNRILMHFHPRDGEITSYIIAVVRRKFTTRHKKRTGIIPNELKRRAAQGGLAAPPPDSLVGHPRPSVEELLLISEDSTRSPAVSLHADNELIRRERERDWAWHG